MTVKSHGTWYLRECMYCETWFWTQMRPRGSKWTSLCGPCLQDEL